MQEQKPRFSTIYPESPKVWKGKITQQKEPWVCMWRSEQVCSDIFSVYCMAYNVPKFIREMYSVSGRRWSGDEGLFFKAFFKSTCYLLPLGILPYYSHLFQRASHYKGRVKCVLVKHTPSQKIHLLIEWIDQQ